jgi:hypothetical protein
MCHMQFHEQCTEALNYDSATYTAYVIYLTGD